MKKGIVLEVLTALLILFILSAIVILVQRESDDQSNNKHSDQLIAEYYINDVTQIEDLAYENSTETINSSAGKALLSLSVKISNPNDEKLDIYPNLFKLRIGDNTYDVHKDAIEFMNDVREGHLYHLTGSLDKDESETVNIVFEINTKDFDKDKTLIIEDHDNFAKQNIKIKETK